MTRIDTRTAQTDVTNRYLPKQSNTDNTSKQSSSIFQAKPGQISLGEDIIRKFDFSEENIKPDTTFKTLPTPPVPNEAPAVIPEPIQSSIEVKESSNNSTFTPEMAAQLKEDQKEAARRGWIGTPEKAPELPDFNKKYDISDILKQKAPEALAKENADNIAGLDKNIKNQYTEAPKPVLLKKTQKHRHAAGHSNHADSTNAAKSGKGIATKKAARQSKAREAEPKLAAQVQADADRAIKQPAQTRKMMTEAERQAAQAEFVRKTGKPNYLYPPSGAEEAPIVRGFKKFWKNVSQPTTIQSGSQSRGLAAIPDAVSPLTRKAQDPTTIHPTRTIKGW